MARGTKRTKRILLIVSVGAVMAAVAGGAYVLRQKERDREAESGRAAGVAAFAAGDYEATLEGMGRYLGRFGNRGAGPADFLLTARARRRVELPNNKHLISAMRTIQRALQLDPLNAEAKSELLDLYVETGMRTEALTLADSMLLAAPGELKLLRTKCDLLEGQRLFAKALLVSREINAAAPDDFENFARTMRLMVASNASAGEVDAWLGSVVASHPGDARFELLRAAVFKRRFDEENAKACLDRAMTAGSSSKDANYVRLLVSELDSADRFADSLRVLETIDPATDPGLSRELVRRLWYAGRIHDVAAKAKALVADPARAEPEILALYALALVSVGRAAEAEPLRAELRSRGDKAGEAWTAFVASLAADPAGSPASAPELANAVAAVPESAFLRQALGDAYAALGETDLALEAWTAASARSGAWSLPLRRMADMLIATGREHLAPALARAAVTRCPSDVASLATYIRATTAIGGDLDKKQIAALMGAVKAIDAAAPEQADATLPVYLDLLVRVDKDAAEERLLEVLAGQPPASETTLIRLALTAARSGIPLESKLLDLSESIHGVTPQLGFARALSRARADGAATGVRVFDELRARAAAATAPLDWDLARASVLEALRSPEAGPSWIRIADAQPEALRAQLGALASDAVWVDRAAVARIIERVRGLTGDQAITWRIARSRWLLAGHDTSEAGIAEAAQILNDVTKAAPRSASARLLLAQAFEKFHNLTGAEEQLRIAAELAPDNMWIALEVARLAQRQGRSEVARRQLDRIVSSQDLAPEQVERAAYLLAVQGDRQRGADLLEPLTGHAQVRRDAALLLAQLYAKLGEPERAIVLCEQLLAAPDLEIVEVTASLLATIGKSAEADAMLDRIDRLDLAPGDRELARARFAAAWGPPLAARQWYEKASHAAPERADVWTARLANAVTMADAAAISAVLDDPRAASVESVRFLASMRPLATNAIRDDRVRALLLAAMDDLPNRPILLDAIRTISSASAAPAASADATRTLRFLADSNVRVLVLQLVAGQQCAHTGDLRSACDIAKRAMSEFPNSAAAARQSAEMLARSGRYDEALVAANQWRARASHRDLDAEVFIAEVILRSGRASDAAAQLEPHVRAAMTRPAENERLLVTFSVALVRSGRVARATDMMADLVRKSERWLAVALAVAPERLGDAKSSADWIKLCAAAIPADDRAANVRLARAWGAAWERYREPGFMDAAQGAVARVIGSPDAPAEAHLVAGTLAQLRGDLPAARTAYLAALRLDPALSAARNNLAVVLADLGEWQAAVEEAGKAAGAETRSANDLDTLAYALRKGKQFERAIASLQEAIRLDPRNPEWFVSLAETQSESGNVDEMRRTLAKVDELSAAGGQIPDPLRRRIDQLRSKSR